MLDSHTAHRVALVDARWTERASAQAAMVRGQRRLASIIRG